jgi:translocation and assembly module TamB
VTDPRSKSPPSKRSRRNWRKYLLILAAVFVAGALGLFIYVHTESFQSLVRRRLVAELERISGGRAEIGSIHTSPFRLQANVHSITIHGREAPGEEPLAHADRITARLKLSSLFGSGLAFYQMTLEQPSIHVAFYPDGSTNIPGSTASSLTPEKTIEQLFALSIDHFELRNGQILWDEQKVPLDFSARDISLRMDYSFLHRRYDGRLQVGLVQTKLPECRPFTWMSAMEFSLSSNSAVIPSLKWNSGHSHFSASGQITDIRRPHFQGQYEGQLDLSDVASIARRPELRAGVLEAKGRGESSLEQFSTEGLLTLRDFGWQDDWISFSRSSVSSGYSISDQALKLSKIQGRIFGGSFNGDAEWNQWLAPNQHLTASIKNLLETATISAAPPAKKSRGVKPKVQAIQAAVVAIRLRDLSVDSVIEGLNTRAHQLPHFHPAGAASGTVEAHWEGAAADAQISLALDVNPPEHANAGEVPLNAHIHGAYYVADESLNLSQFAAETPTSRVQASGTLSQASALHFSVSTSSVADWIPVLEVVRGPEMIPVSLNGSAIFNGSMTGSVSAPQVGGSLQIQDFNFNIAATAHTRALETHWDSFSASLQASFQNLILHKATLRRDGASADFEASATLQHGHLTGDSNFTLRASIQNTDLAGIQALLGYEYPVSGRVDSSVQAGGTLGDPHAEGQIHLVDGSAYGESIRQFDSVFRLEHGEIGFSNTHLFHDGGVVTGNATYNSASRSFALDLTGRNFDLGELRQFRLDRLPLNGQADFTVKASGTTDTPEINATAHVKNLTVDGDLAGDFDLQTVTQGRELHVTGNSKFQHGSLEIAGNIGLAAGYPAHLHFQASQLDIDALWRMYAGRNFAGHSAIGGSFELQGPLTDPAHWTVAGGLDAFAFDTQAIKLQQREPTRFSVASGTLWLERLHVTGEGTDLRLHGSMQLGGERALDLSAEGSVDMKLLSTFDPNFTSSGLVGLNVKVGGTVANPAPQGQLQLANGSIAYAGLPSGLTELNGSVDFSRDYLHIDTLTAHTGGGMVDLKGDATYFNQQLNFNLTGTAKDVRLRYPPGVSSTADAELHWVGTRSASTISGDIRVNKMAITPGFDFSAYLERGRQFTTVTGANSPLNDVKLDIHVTTSPELQMRTAVARLSGDADLRLRGSLARPAVLGRVDILEGQATFHGTKFTLERGDITFTNPVAIEPQLNLQASTRVRSYDLNVTLTGTPDRGLNLNYRSEPPLPKSDIIALLALGRTSGQSEQLQEQAGESTFADQASAQILNEALNSTVTSRWQRLFGASNIKIDPQGLTTENNPISNGPQITIEQQFANHISLTYSTNVSQSSEQIIQGEYYFNRDVSAVGTRDQNGVVSFDLLVRQRKK